MIEAIPAQRFKFARDDCWSQSLRLERFPQNGADQIDAKKQNSPQTDDTGKGEQHPNDRIFAPTRIAE